MILKKRNKILLSLLFIFTIATTPLIYSKIEVDAYYTVGTFGKTRYLPGGTSDSMYVEVETDKGWINLANVLAGLSTNMSYYYGSKTQVNYILTEALSLYNSGGIIMSTYPRGAILSITNTDIAFFDSNFTLLENYTSGSLAGYYMLYDLTISDYFIAYNDGFRTGHSTGYAQGNTDGYNTGFTQGQTAGFAQGEIVGFKDGYVTAALTAYEDGFLQVRADFIDMYTTTELSHFVEELSFTYINAYDDGYDDGYDEAKTYYGVLDEGVYIRGIHVWNDAYLKATNAAFLYGYNKTIGGTYFAEKDSFSYNKGLLDAPDIAFQEDYDKGYLDGSNDSFQASIGDWIVPAIIIVLIGGGVLSIVAYRRRQG